MSPNIGFRGLKGSFSFPPSFNEIGKYANLPSPFPEWMLYRVRSGVNLVSNVFCVLPI